jgi:hypothetical protein
MAAQFEEDPRFNDVRTSSERRFPVFYCVFTGRDKFLFIDKYIPTFIISVISFLFRDYARLSVQQATIAYTRAVYTSCFMRAVIGMLTAGVRVDGTMPFIGPAWSTAVLFPKLRYPPSPLAIS